MTILQDVRDETLIFFTAPWPFVQSHLVATRSSHHLCFCNLYIYLDQWWQSLFVIFTSSPFSYSFSWQIEKDTKKRRIWLLHIYNNNASHRELVNWIIQPRHLNSNKDLCEISRKENPLMMFSILYTWYLVLTEIKLIGQHNLESTKYRSPNQLCFFSYLVNKMTKIH